jgi:hypothetical protein
MRSTRQKQISAVASCAAAIGLSLAPAIVAQKSDTPPAPPAHAAASDNPLLAADPFVGTFAGDEIKVVIKSVEGELTGQIHRGGRAFPLTIQRAANGVTGSLVSGDKSFAFTAVIEGDTMTFTTGGQPFKLTRRGDAPPAPTLMPLPQVPDPAKPSTPGALTPPSLPSVLPSAPKAAPQPVAPAAPVRPAERANKLAAPLTAAPADSRRALWTRWPKGTYIVVELTDTAPNELPRLQRHKLQFDGVQGDSLNWRQHRDVDGRWQPILPMKSPVSQADDLESLGYVARGVETRRLTIDGRAYDCQVKTYTLEEAGTPPTAMRAELWTCDAFRVPPFGLNIAGGQVEVGNHAVKLIVEGKVKGNDFHSTTELLETRKQVEIAGQLIDCMRVRTTSSAFGSEGPMDSISESLLSHDAPGGLVKATRTVTATKGADKRVWTRTEVLLDMGTQAEAGATKP